MELPVLNGKLMLFHIKDEYVEFLRNYGDQQVLYNENAVYHHPRPYLGPFMLNGYRYFAPLSSIKPYDLQMENGVLIIKPSTNYIERIVNFSGMPIGKIKFTHLIPVPKEGLIAFNIHELTYSPAYISSLATEAKYCSNHEERLKKMANVVYEELSVNPYGKQTRFNYLEKCADLYVNKLRLSVLANAEREREL
jgi:hypothetical protein